MAEEKEYDSALDELNALMSGEKKLEIVTDEENDEGTDRDEELDEELDDDEAGTNDDGDGDDQDSDEDDNDDEEDDDEANTPVDDYDDEDNEKKSQDGTDTEDENDDKGDGTNDQDNPDTEKIDYKKMFEESEEKYKKIQTFYDEVTADFKANGVMVKGFTDPKQFIQSNQMAAGLSAKLQEFKQYRPFMATMREKGLIDNPAEFDFLMALKDKDLGAIKKLVKDSGIDPIELEDEDGPSYVHKQYAENEITLALDDVTAVAMQHGVQDKFENELGEQWLKDGSLVNLLKDQDKANAVVQHMATVNENGVSAYDEINARIQQKMMQDPYGTYGSKSKLEKYEIAAGELEAELNEAMRISKLEQLKQNNVEDAKAKIAEQRKQDEYKAKVEANANKVNERRKKAANLSRPKTRKKAKPKFDPIEESQKLQGDELMAYFNKQILGRNY